MKLINISSHQQLLGLLSEGEKTYVLIYKKGSEQSDCSYTYLSEAAEKQGKIKVLAVDVTQVDDIHRHYSITTAPSLLVFDGRKMTNIIKGCQNEQYYAALFENAVFSATTKKGEEPQKRVTVYTTPTCSWCTTLKSHLKNNNIRYKEIDISRDQPAAQAMVRKSGQQGVPQTDINGEMIVGFDKKRINTLLGIQ